MHPGHPAVQRGGIWLGHGRLPVFRDADLPLGRKFQVSRPPPGLVTISHDVNLTAQYPTAWVRSLMTRSKLYIGHWSSKIVLNPVSGTDPENWIIYEFLKSTPSFYILIPQPAFRLPRLDWWLPCPQVNPSKPSATIAWEMVSGPSELSRHSPVMVSHGPEDKVTGLVIISNLCIRVKLIWADGIRKISQCAGSD